MHGEQGESGVCAWKVAGACSREERLLIPPTISNSGVGGTRSMSKMAFNRTTGRSVNL